MTINSRLLKMEESMTYREIALLWLASSQEKGGYLEYWKFAEFQPWAADHIEAGLLYFVAGTVNSEVLVATRQWRALARWGSLLGIAMLDGGPDSKVQPQRVTDFFNRWRDAVSRLFADVVAMQHSVDLISAGYFDGHDVLFCDCKKELWSSFESAKLLILSYNCFAEENGKEMIDIEVVANQLGHRVEQRCDEWVALAKSKALAASGELFKARDELMGFITAVDGAENT